VTGWLDYLLNAAVAAGATYLAAWRYPRLTRPPVKPNHRGAMLPLSLGGAVTLGLVVLDVVSLPVVAFHIATTGHGVPQKVWVLIGAILLVFAAGAYDDRHTARTRGIVAQLRPLASGTVTPGAVKLLALVAGATAYAAVIQSPPARLALGVPVVAGIANAWNLLDVQPGRALRFALVTAVPLFVYRPTRMAARIVAASAVALPLDLRERAMLGDAGANVLGFALGVAIFDRLSTLGLAVALALVIAAHVASETITLSRVIGAVPPLRWFDDLGRARHQDNEHSTST
jgi:UDP-N-acetylmuramyl pentapeptide phosphotransferase/UDP-N-acetylglucosamine-1-phosphate transferase